MEANEIIEYFLNERINRIERELSKQISDERRGELEGQREEWEALKEIFDVEGFGGRESGVTDQQTAEEVCTERRAWLRDQIEEGFRSL